MGRLFGIAHVELYKVGYSFLSSREVLSVVVLIEV
jgi:hypothetical protein